MPETDPERIAQVKQDAATRLLALPGVTLVALGSKETGGRPTGELVIRVHVQRKRPAGEIPPEELIPAEIDGVRTDVVVGEGIVPVAAPPGAVVRSQDSDEATVRPMEGGAMIMTEDATHLGTLGVMLWKSDNHDAGFGLTNMHVIDEDGTRPVLSLQTRVGQPTGTSSSTCCDDIMGVFAGGERAEVTAGGIQASVSDQAVVLLDAGMKWKAEIKEIGLVAGSYPATPDDALHQLPVRKRGARTRLSGGVITDVAGTNGVAHNMMVISPNNNPDRKPAEPLFFVDQGDSGSVAVTDQNRVTALIFARRLTRAEITAKGGTPPPLPADGIERVAAVAWPIGDVLDRFQHELPSWDLEVAIATQPDQIHVVPGAASVAVPHELVAGIVAEPAAFLGSTAPGGALLAPVGRPWFGGDRPSADVLAELRRAVDASATGRLLGEVWAAHERELRALVAHDRQVTVAWHRGGGAALFQLALRMLTRPEPARSELALPETLNGVPVAVCLDRLVATLVARGTPGLGADLRRARSALPDLGGRTLPEIAVALGAEPVPVAGTAPLSAGGTVGGIVAGTVAGDA